MSPLARSAPGTTRLSTRPISSSTDSQSRVCAAAMMTGSRVKMRISQGAASAASKAMKPEASMPLRTPFLTIASAARSEPEPTRRPTMISQAQPIAMLMISTYLSVCST